MSSEAATDGVSEARTAPRPLDELPEGAHGELLAAEMTPELAKELKRLLGRVTPRTWRRRVDALLQPLSGFVAGPGAHPPLDAAVATIADGALSQLRAALTEGLAREEMLAARELLTRMPGVYTFTDRIGHDDDGVLHLSHGADDDTDDIEPVALRGAQLTGRFVDRGTWLGTRTRATNAARCAPSERTRYRKPRRTRSRRYPPTHARAYATSWTKPSSTRWTRPPHATTCTCVTRPSVTPFAASC